VSEYDRGIYPQEANKTSIREGGKVDIFDLQKSGEDRKPIVEKVTNNFLFEGLCEKIHVYVLTSMSQRVDLCKFQESKKTDLRLLRLARPLVKISGDHRHIKEYNPAGLQAPTKISSYTRVRFSTLTSSRCEDKQGS
jgi:hypothetical protein